MKHDMSFREFVAFVLMAMFGYILWYNPTDATIIGALLTGFAGAWGFYLGGSKVGADSAAKNSEIVGATAAASTGGPAPKDAADGARQAADAADAEATNIEAQTFGMEETK